MSYLGNEPADKFLTIEKQTFTTSATDTYTLDRSVSSPNDIELFLNNVRQEPTSAYTISGTTLTLASAITASDSMYCIYQGRSVGSVAPASNSVTNDMLVNSSITLNGSAVSLGGSANTGFETQLLHVQDQKANGTTGGDFNSGYQTRTLNTIVTNEITGASLSSNQITLPAGTYYIEGSCPGYQVQRHRCKLRNNTDSSDILFGTGEYVSTAASVTNKSFISGRFTLVSSKVVIIQHYAQTTKSSFGFGVDASSGDIEIYTDIKIWKVA